jgi:hypothetical protein
MREYIDMDSKKEHQMLSWIDKYDAALANKEKLASIYDKTWRRGIRSKLLESGRFVYLGNAFGYQAPMFEETGLIPKGWQYRLEEGAKILLPQINNREQGHLIKRMRDTESTSAEEELLLARGFSSEFGQDAISLPQTSSTATSPEFELNACGHRIMVEAKGRVTNTLLEQEREQMRRIGCTHGFRIEMPWIDDKIEKWIKNKIYSTLHSKAVPDKGFILVLSIYTFPSDLCMLIDMVREFAENPGNPKYYENNRGDLNLPPEHWALVIALVFHGRIQGVWFNRSVRDRLSIDTTTQEHIRAAIKKSFYYRQDKVFFHEGLTAKEHRSVMYGMRE